MGASRSDTLIDWVLYLKYHPYFTFFNLCFDMVSAYWHLVKPCAIINSSALCSLNFHAEIHIATSAGGGAQKKMFEKNWRKFSFYKETVSVILSENLNVKIPIVSLQKWLNYCLPVGNIGKIIWIKQLSCQKNNDILHTFY